MNGKPYVFQKTIGKSGHVSGAGLHTGKSCTLTFHPALPDTGLRFFLDGKPLVDQDRQNTEPLSSGSLRCSRIGTGERQLLTVEHLLASFCGLGITNLVVEAEGPEVPGMDGSALPFVELFQQLGIVEQAKTVEFYRITEPIFCYDDLKSLCIYPAEDLSISYTLDYDHPYLRDQQVDFVLTPEIFKSQIAPSRTFCTDKEARELPKHGFGLGATRQNTLVIHEDGSHQAQLRFADECARHKVLDILGDLTLAGVPVLGRIVGLRSGHALNQKLVEAIKAQRGGRVKLPMGLEEIKKILPHREPFLFVDRIIEMTERSIVGVKNLSGREPFFAGHFPARPVMPGVLMVEALAQAGGVLMLSRSEHQGKIAYLASVNEARFRRIVSPGDELRLEVELLKFKARVGLVRGVAKVGSDVACEAQIMFSLAD